MKRFSLFLLMLVCPMSVHAVGSVWSSSHTATADSLKSLCGSNNKRRGVLHSVCVNDGPGGTVTLFDSVLSNTTTFAVIRTTSAVTAGCLLFDVVTSSGITYTTSAPNDITFSYSCY